MSLWEGPKSADDQITVIAVVRNRSKSIIDNFVYTLLHQTIVPRILIVDYGSDEEHLKDLQSIWWSNRGFTIISAAKRTDKFCKARGMNIGIQKVETRFTFCSDIDIMFGKQSVENVLQILSSRPRSFITLPTFLLYRGLNYRKMWDENRLFGRYYGDTAGNRL